MRSDRSRAALSRAAFRRPAAARGAGARAGAAAGGVAAGRAVFGAGHPPAQPTGAPTARDARRISAASTLVVSHNLEEIYRLCEELVVLDQGQRDRARLARGDLPLAAQPAGGAADRLQEFFARASARYALRRSARLGMHAARGAGDSARARGRGHPRPSHSRDAGGAPPDRAPDENTFPCWLAAVSEAPFHVTLYLRLHAPASRSLRLSSAGGDHAGALGGAEIRAFPMVRAARSGAALPASGLDGSSIRGEQVSASARRRREPTGA